MIRAWVGLALLSGSWLFGVPYFHPVDWPVWAATLLLGTVLIASGQPHRKLAMRPNEPIVGLVMLLPTVWFLPWPYRAAPVLLAAGLLVQVVPMARRWPGALGRGAITAGGVLLAQALAMLAYAVQTARCHDLPWPLASALGFALRLLGIDAAVHAETITLHSHGEIHWRAAIHRMGATWELLIDPASLCFLAGGLVLLGVLVGRVCPGGKRWALWIRTIRVLALLMAAWLPFRAAGWIALYLHRVLRADPSVAPTAMSHFFSPEVALLALAGPVVLAWWFLRLPAEEREIDRNGTDRKETQGKETESSSAPASRAVFATSRPGVWFKPAASLGLIALGVGLVAWLIVWDPVGDEKGRRVLVVERHSTWEPTDRAYDTEHFGHDPSYSYTRIYDYCGQFFEMSRLQESDPIDDDSLARCDVLVIKVPTEPFTPKEIEAVVRFVRFGGSVLLVGDHTNVFHSTTHLNPIARHFGFTFRHDILFQIGSPYVEPHDWPAIGHPVVEHVPPVHFAGPCSIDPGNSLGRIAVMGSGLWSLPPEYSADNTYFPQAEYGPDMRYGTFIELWATRFGRGRVLAFGDSTIFSNFCTFEPGKAEFMAGMLGWLNRQSLFDRPAPRFWLGAVLLLASVASLLAGFLFARAYPFGWPTLVAAGLLGFTVASTAVGAIRHRAMPKPVPKRPMVEVVIDRTVSEVPLSSGGFTEPGGRGYGLLEQWTARLGYRTRRATGPEAFSGDALVVLCPTRSVSESYRQRAIDYVAAGGRLLVIDSPDVVGSTANSILSPFGLVMNHATSAQGMLRLSENWPREIRLGATCEVEGGEPLLWVDQTPVAARARHGKGSVMAVGFGALFDDAAMGSTWIQDPAPESLRRYDVLFALLEAAVQGKPISARPSRPDSGTPSQPES